MNQAKLSPPWADYYNQLRELFANDREVTIDTAPDNDKAVLVRVTGNPAKADALGKLLPPAVEFGGVKVTIAVVPDNEISLEGLIRTAFAGNAALSDVVTSTDAFGTPVTYALFAPRAVQYFNDDISHPEGRTTRLLQDVARNVLTGLQSDKTVLRISSATKIG